MGSALIPTLAGPGVGGYYFGAAPNMNEQTHSPQRSAWRRHIRWPFLLALAAVLIIGGAAWLAGVTGNGSPPGRTLWDQERQAIDNLRRTWDSKRRAWDQQRRANEQAQRAALQAAGNATNLVPAGQPKSEGSESNAAGHQE